MKEAELKVVCDAYEAGVGDGRTDSGYFKHAAFPREQVNDAYQAYFYGRQVGIRQFEDQDFAPRVLALGAVDIKGHTPILDAKTSKVVCLVPDATIAAQIAFVLSGAYQSSPRE